MIKNNQIILSQSITKDLGLFVIDDQLEHIEWCPKMVYHKHIAEDYEQKTSEVMMHGLYAETILLGSCARGQSVETLPTKKNGEKTVTQERIDVQMQRMFGFLYAKGAVINEYNKQIPLIAKYADGVWIRGEFDMFPTVFDGVPSIIDVKTTKDVYNTFFSYKEDKIRFTTSSCWGDFEHIAKNQPLFYHFLAKAYINTGFDTLCKYNPTKVKEYEYLFHQEHHDEYNFHFVVAGIGKPNYDDQMAVYTYNMTPHRETLLDMLVSASLERIREGVKSSFKPSPKPFLCKKCGMKEKCSVSV